MSVEVIRAQDELQCGRCRQIVPVGDPLVVVAIDTAAEAHLCRPCAREEGVMEVRELRRDEATLAAKEIAVHTAEGFMVREGWRIGTWTAFRMVSGECEEYEVVRPDGVRAKIRVSVDVAQEVPA